MLHHPTALLLDPPANLTTRSRIPRQVIKEQKLASAAAGDESDTILAFQALGGNADKTGIISAERLRKTCKVRV